MTTDENLSKTEEQRSFVSLDHDSMRYTRKMKSCKENNLSLDSNPH